MSIRRASHVTVPAVPAGDGSGASRLLLWAVFFVNSLFLIPPCLDRYLAPRFLFLSLVLLAALPVLWRDRARLFLFDLLLICWYAWNLASLGWAFNGSEAIFYSQKVVLLLLTYCLIRQVFSRNEVMALHVLRQCTIWLTVIVGVIVSGQLLYAASLHGLNNEALYDYAIGVYGNKSLAAAFLFFLLIFNVLFENNPRPNRFFWLRTGLLTGLILLLQTRAVYLALIVSTVFYLSGRSMPEPDFRSVFFKKILPPAIGFLVLLAAFLSMKGRGTSLSERLNPLTYLESASANERRFVWYKTDLLNREHPWLGVGNGSWKFWFPSKNIQGAFRLQEQNIVFTRAHNDYLEVQAELGWIGLALFCALFILLFGVAAWTIRTLDAQKHRELLTLLAGLLGYCIIQFFDFPRERIEMQVVLAVLFAGIVWRSRAGWERLPAWTISETWRQVGLAAAAIALAFNVVIGWNRVTGEIHAVRMLEAQAGKNYQGVVHESAAAINRFYEYDDVAIPLVWYAGGAHVQMNQLRAALADFRAAYLLNPWSFHVLDKYATTLIQNGQYAEAIPLLEKAVSINPKFEEAKFNLSYTQYQLGDYTHALEWLDRVDTIPNPQTMEQRSKNRTLLAQKSKFQQVIQEAQNKR